MDRRIFLKTIGAIGGSGLTIRAAKADTGGRDSTQVGVLVDETRCVGCRMCEMVCAQGHGLPAPDFSDKNIFENQRATTEEKLTVINRFQTEKGKVFVKKQCMHCVQPACAAACLTRAMFKTKEGPVIWRENKCIGCRYCMISCPFRIPKFEYNVAVPKIRKCDMCWDLLQAGKQPACVENCPARVMQFGKRSELIETARTRIYREPDRYLHSVYGENEIGGTGWMYASAVPFEQLALKTDLGTTPYPEYTKQFLYSVPVVLLLWPVMLLGLHKAAEEDQRK